jgi:hypothetical protein
MPGSFELAGGWIRKKDTPDGPEGQTGKGQEDMPKDKPAT